MRRDLTYRSLALLVAAELALSPLAIANSTQAPARGSSSERQREAHWTENMAAIMGGVNQVAKGVLSGLQMQVAQQEAMNQMNALTSQLNPANCGTPTQPTQCVSEVFPECNILNTRPNFVEPSDCANGLDGTDPAAAAKSGAVMGYYNHFAQMENIYKNFSLETNATSNTGMGCLNAKADQLARALKKREDEIDNLINKMQKAQDAFKKQAEADRNKIEDSMALLEGEGFRGATRNGKAILDQNSVNFANAFNDPACQAVLSGDEFKKTGAKGLKGIEARLSEIANKKEGTGFNAMEFNNNTAQNLEKDIRRMADLAAREIEVGNAAAFIKDGVKDLPSNYGLNDSAAFRSALTEQQKEARIKELEISQEIAAFTGGRSENLVSTLKNDRADFEFALNQWERAEKDACLQRQSNISALLTNKLKIIDPAASSTANRDADNAYRTFIQATLARSDLTIERKLQLIAEEEAKNNNSRYLVNTQASAAVDGSVIEATTRMTPAAFIQVHVENCKQQFERNANEKGFSGRQVVEKLREARNKYSAFQKTLAGKVKASIVDRMLNCGDNLKANASGVGTCTPKELSSSSQDFCVKRANACATNMRQCFAKAEKQVKDVVAKRDQAVAQYKANLAKNEADLNKMYAMVEQITAVDGLNIAANLKQSLVLPTKDLKFHIDQDKRQMVRGLEAMEVQDPDQYFEQMKKNLLSLKDQVAQQNRAVMYGSEETGLAKGASTAQKGVYGHIANIQANMKSTLEEIAQYKGMCQQAFQAFMNGQRQQRAQAAEAMQKQQQEQAQYCSRLQSMGTGPGCESADEFDDILTAAAKAGDTGVAQYYRRFRAHCRSIGADGNQDVMTLAQLQRTYQSQGVVDELTYCTKVRGISVSDATADGDACNKYLYWTKNCRSQSGSNQPREEFCEEYKVSSLKEAVRNTAPRTSAGGANGQAQETPEQREERIVRESSQLGENRSAVCAAYNNSGSGTIGKALIDTLDTLGQAYGSGTIGR